MMKIAIFAIAIVVVAATAEMTNPEDIVPEADFAPSTEFDADSVGGPRFLGCYQDNGSRDFRHGPKRYGYTSTKCAAACKSYKYVALQNNGWCSCDNGYSSPSRTYPKKPSNQCNKGGSGKGGPWRNAVYANPYNAKPAHMIGCYQDNGARDFRHGPKRYGYTASKCMNACKTSKYVALQNNGWCSCDNSYSTPSRTYPKKPNGDCTKGGPGMGGGWRNAVYTNVVYHAEAKKKAAAAKKEKKAKDDKKKAEAKKRAADKKKGFVGCFKDKGDRDLPVRKGSGSLNQCKSKCKGYKFMGHQWTGECWCGNKHGKHGKTSGCKCETKNIGGWKQCIYKLLVPAKKKAAKKRTTKKKSSKKSSMTFAGNGCCRFSGWKAKGHGMQTEAGCKALCEKDSKCSAADVARPRGGKFDCYTFYGNTKDLKTQCNTKSKNEKCFKKGGAKKSTKKKKKTTKKKKSTKKVTKKVVETPREKTAAEKAAEKEENKWTKVEASFSAKAHKLDKEQRKQARDYERSLQADQKKLQSDTLKAAKSIKATDEQEKKDLKKSAAFQKKIKALEAKLKKEGKKASKTSKARLAKYKKEMSSLAKATKAEKAKGAKIAAKMEADNDAFAKEETHLKKQYQKKVHAMKAKNAKDIKEFDAAEKKAQAGFAAAFKKNKDKAAFAMKALKAAKKKAKEAAKRAADKIAKRFAAKKKATDKANKRFEEAQKAQAAALSAKRGKEADAKAKIAAKAERKYQRAMEQKQKADEKAEHEAEKERRMEEEEAAQDKREEEEQDQDDKDDLAMAECDMDTECEDPKTGKCLKIGKKGPYLNQEDMITCTDKYVSPKGLGLSWEHALPPMAVEKCPPKTAACKKAEAACSKDAGCAKAAKMDCGKGAIHVGCEEGKKSLNAYFELKSECCDPDNIGFKDNVPMFKMQIDDMPVYKNSGTSGRFKANKGAGSVCDMMKSLVAGADAGFGGDEEEFKDEDMSKQAKFVGCYKDNAKRDLPVRKGNGDKDTCAERCQDYKYFGHQYKGECWCGNEMGKYGKTTGCKCDAKNIGGWKQCIYEMPADAAYGYGR